MKAECSCSQLATADRFRCMLTAADCDTLVHTMYIVVVYMVVVHHRLLFQVYTAIEQGLAR